MWTTTVGFNKHEAFDWGGTGEDPADRDSTRLLPRLVRRHAVPGKRTNTNPTSNYQLDITISDAVSEKVGAVTKGRCAGRPGRRRYGQAAVGADCDGAERGQRCGAVRVWGPELGQ